MQERSPFAYACRSIANDRHPLRNEDSTLIDEQTGLVAVFDGVGGSAAAEIAFTDELREQLLKAGSVFSHSINAGARSTRC